MIQSMTGYGQTVVVYEGKKIHVEIKSLNSKQLDLTTRIAPFYREKEMEIRQRIGGVLLRGKVDFALWVEVGDSDTSATLNRTVVESYYKQIQAISKQCDIPEPEDWFATLLRLPDATTKTEKETLSAEEWGVVSGGIDEAINQLVSFRSQEGAALEKIFTEKIENITNLLASIEPYEQQRVEKIRQRIIDALSSLPEVSYDTNRLEQEMIYYIEKLDISEEKQRLANHLTYFMETLHGEVGQGKKLGFIAQEMGREINTTGSKSNQAEMQNIVVRMKDELEQIKEQVLNVL